MKERMNPYKQFFGCWIPLWLLERPEISPGAKLVYATLARHAGKNGECFPGQDLLSREIGLVGGERTVRRYLNELVENCLIEKIQQGLNKPNRYFFLSHEWMKNAGNKGPDNLSGQDRQEESPGPDKLSGQEVQDLSGQEVHILSGPLKDKRERTNENQLKEKKNSPLPWGEGLENPIPDQIPDGLWRDFIEHRKSLKSPLTEFSIKHLKKELFRLEESGSDPTEVIRQSICRGWKGLFPVENRTITKNRNRFDEGIVRTNKKTSYLEQARLHTIRKYGIASEQEETDEKSLDSGIIRSGRKTSYLGRDGFEIGDLVRTGEKIGKIEGIEQKNGKIKVIARTVDGQIFSFEKNLES